MTNIGFTPSGPPETVLPTEPHDAVSALEQAMSLPDDQRRAALVDILSQHPRFLDGWARLGEIGRDPIERYAAFRVGYHRGLDTLRQNGWRGSGYVRWQHETNRGFLRALAGLQRSAAEIGEHEEDQRCAVFLRQLDPSWPPSSD